MIRFSRFLIVVIFAVLVVGIVVILRLVGIRPEPRVAQAQVDMGTDVEPVESVAGGAAAHRVAAEQILNLPDYLRLWAVAHLFFLKGTDDARRLVRERMPYVLNGNTAELIAEFWQLGTQHGLRGTKAAALKRACQFLENNLHRMKYDEYLKAGYPIATGVIEGACRHVIKDRMERTGMRWKVPGAQAMLELRAIAINGDWAAFQTFRIERENYRLYPHKDVVERIPWPIAA